MNLFDTIKYRLQYTFNKFINDIFIKRQIKITYKLLSVAIKDFEKNLEKQNISNYRTDLNKLKDYLSIGLSNQTFLQELRKTLNNYRLFIVVRKGTQETIITVYALPEAFNLDNKELVTTKVQLEKIII